MSYKDNQENNHFCKFTFGQFFALLVLEVFALVLVFYLGAKYGREFLNLGDSMYSAETEESKVLTTADPEIKAMADEIIKSARKPSLKARVEELLSEEQHKSNIEQEKEEAENEKFKKETLAKRSPQWEEKVVIKTPENNTEKASEVNDIEYSGKHEMVRVKSADYARYSIQIGSFPELAEANKSVKTWKVKGYNAFMMIADIPDRGRWYRVRIGGFATKDEAKRYLDEFSSKEKSEAIVVLNEQ